jgi:hypothetical protein
LVVAKDQVIPTQCEGIVMARLQSQLGVENKLVEPSPKAPPPEGFYIAKKLSQHRQEGPVSVINATHRDQKLIWRTPQAQSKRVTLVTPPDLEWQQDHESSSKLQDVTEAARQHLSKREFLEFEELLAEWK